MFEDKQGLPCQEVKRSISEASAEELRTGVNSSVRAHLEICANCETYQQQMVNLSTHLNALSFSALAPQTQTVSRWSRIAAIRGNPRLAVAITFALLAVLGAAFSWYLSFVLLAPPEPSAAEVPCSKEAVIMKDREPNMEAY